MTLKTRTGWDRDDKNGVRIAQIAEDCGIQALAFTAARAPTCIGATRSTRPWRAIKRELKIPVFANGDIDSPQRAHAELGN